MLKMRKCSTSQENKLHFLISVVPSFEELQGEVTLSVNVVAKEIPL